ncbi:MAG: phosphodiester glycosidase family protein [Planctomycetota bacterium]
MPILTGSILSAAMSALLACSATGTPVPMSYGEDVLHGPIRAIEVVLETQDGPARGWIAEVDLSWRDQQGRAVEIEVTGPIDEKEEARLEPTDVWAERVSATLAVNANFFGWLGGGMAEVQGLAVSDGLVVSTPRISGDRPDPAVLFFEADGVVRADATYQGRDLPPGVTEAVAGIGPSGTSPVPGSMLVEEGEATGWTARVEPDQRHPRTAIGVSRDGTRVYVAVIDGRQPGWSVGVTLPELAETMRAIGAWEAVNLDGGGSSAFVLRSSTEDPMTNRPSGGRFRAVANSIGFRLPMTEPIHPGGAGQEPPDGDHRTGEAEEPQMPSEENDQ